MTALDTARQRLARVTATGKMMGWRVSLVDGQLRAAHERAAICWPLPTSDAEEAVLSLVLRQPVPAPPLSTAEVEAARERAKRRAESRAGRLLVGRGMHWRREDLDR